MQCSYYLTLGGALSVGRLLFRTSLSLDHFWTEKHMNPESASGWVGIASVIAASFIGAVMLAVVVEKSRKCLDFGATVFLFHLLFCTLLREAPSTWAWWVVHIVGLLVMVVLGEYLCSRVEMRDIPLVSL